VAPTCGAVVRLGVAPQRSGRPFEVKREAKWDCEGIFVLADDASPPDRMSFELLASAVGLG
jgi:hypothetical protein